MCTKVYKYICILCIFTFSVYFSIVMIERRYYAMRYDDDAYREVFPKKQAMPEMKVETPIETFMPSVKEETLVNQTPEPVIEEPLVNQTNEPVNDNID